MLWKNKPTLEFSEMKLFLDFLELLITLLGHLEGLQNKINSLRQKIVLTLHFFLQTSKSGAFSKKLGNKFPLTVKWRIF